LSFANTVSISRKKESSMNRRQFLRTAAATTAATAACLGVKPSPAIGRAVEPTHMSARETSRDDPRAPIVDQETFEQIVELEIRRAIRLQYYASLLVLQLETDEPWPHSRISRYRLIAEAARDQIRGTDVLSVKPSLPAVQVLMPSLHHHDLRGVIQRIATAVNGRKFDTHGATALPTLCVGAASFPTTARNRVEIFRLAELLSREARVLRRAEQ